MMCYLFRLFCWTMEAPTPCRLGFNGHFITALWMKCSINHWCYCWMIEWGLIFDQTSMSSVGEWKVSSHCNILIRPFRFLGSGCHFTIFHPTMRLVDQHCSKSGIWWSRNGGMVEVATQNVREVYICQSVVGGWLTVLYRRGITKDAGGVLRAAASRTKVKTHT